MEVTLVPHVPLEKRALTMTLENGGLEPQTQRVYRLENGMAKMQFDLRRLRSVGLVTLDYRVTIGDLEQKGQIMLNISTPNKVYPLDIIEKGLARETEHAKTAVSMNRIQVKLADGSLSPYFLMVNRKALVKRAMISCGKVEKLGVFVKPMQQHSEGGFAIEDTIHVPDDKIDVVLRADVGKWDGCVSGSSATYRVELVAANGRRVTLAEQEQLQYGWSHLEADLSPWRGQDVTLRLITNVKGPTDVQDSARSNVGCWANVRLESKKKVYIRKVLSSTP